MSLKFITNKSYAQKVLLSLMALFLASCLEEFDFQTETFESAIVVEATITNEFKNHTVLITRTFRFEEDGPSAESNANVTVVSNTNTYTFQETTPGVYVSTTPFSAQAGIDYQLLITTSDGRNYQSATTQLTNVTQIDTIEANRITNDDGENGMQITVDSFDPTGNSKYYRYTYEETYKIIAPLWSPLDAQPSTDPGSCDLSFLPRVEENRTCFASNNSNSIILTDTTDFIEDRVSGFEVRFLDSNNYIISHRYSILVYQYVQSLEAYTFYRTLRDLSSSESLFNQNQPGFFAGNVTSVSNENEKVIGFFEVSSVDSERIFFNYADFYPNEPLPDYVISCTTVAPELQNEAGCVLSLQVAAGNIEYVADNSNPDPDTNEGPYLMASPPCV
ncbi:MAG: DUF4249 domain-containing protein, partial [Flavobacteriaceae bacterium]|nr:DUF4249 domain-containing protein [Flavobacteriaceae bacterium]